MFPDDDKYVLNEAEIGESTNHRRGPFIILNTFFPLLPEAGFLALQFLESLGASRAFRVRPAIPDRKNRRAFAAAFSLFLCSLFIFLLLSQSLSPSIPSGLVQP